MGYITGIARNQMILFPESLEEYVDENNPVRVLDAFVDSLELGDIGITKSSPSDTGRPPYSPYDMLKLYVYGYMNRIRSTRRMETETKRNVEVMWLLEKLSPDHKTISRFRKDNAKALKGVFREFVKLCTKLGLYGRELAAIDGSKFKAVNSKDRNLSTKEINERIKKLDSRIDEYMKQLDEADTQEDVSGGCVESAEIVQIVENLKERKEKYNGYLEEMESEEETQKSLTDPDSRMMKGASGYDVSYNVQTSVDSKHKLIAEFKVTNYGNDMNQLSDMALSTAEILDAPNITVVADDGFNNASEIAKCLQNGISPQVSGSGGSICVPCDEHEAEEIVSHENGRGVHIKERNIVICPMGQVMYPGCYQKSGRQARYYNGKACAKCKCRCTDAKYRTFDIRMKKSEFSKEYNAENLYIRQVKIKVDTEITKTRKEIAEHPFGTVKRAMEAGHLLTKGIESVTGEFSLAFLAYNIKRVVNILGVKKLINALT